MARCAVGFLGDDVDDRQILETSLERKVNAAFMPQAAAVATPQAMEEDIVEWAEPAAKASAVADSAAGPRGHIDTLISKTCPHLVLDLDLVLFPSGHGITDARGARLLPPFPHTLRP